MKQSKVLFVALTALAVLATGALAVAVIAAVPADYKGKPWKDTPQVIPGKVWMAYYDVGGEGVAYHDVDKQNHGSGELNRGPAEKDNFRKDEGVDISYTKAAFDKWKDAGKKLDVDEYYVGWTSPEEWTNYTVDVKEAGTYVVNLKASANNAGTQISDRRQRRQWSTPSTSRQTGYWHTWLMHNNICELKLDKGLNLITFKHVKEGNMNVMWLEFVPKGAEAPSRPPSSRVVACLAVAGTATGTANSRGGPRGPPRIFFRCLSCATGCLSTRG